MNNTGIQFILWIFRQKNASGNLNQDAAQFYKLKQGVALGYECADIMRKVRIVLSELFYIQSQIFEQNQLNTVRGPNENIKKQSELFDNDIYLEEITHIICIALAELPSLFNIQEVIETLLYVNSGSTIICWVVANMPDCFKEGMLSVFIIYRIESNQKREHFKTLFSIPFCSGDSPNIQW